MRNRVKKGPEPEELRPFEFSSTGGLRGMPPSHQPVRGVGMGPSRALCEPPGRRFRFPPLGVYLHLRREARFSVPRRRRTRGLSRKAMARTGHISWQQ